MLNWAILVLLLIAATAALVTERLRADLAALLLLMGLAATGILTPQETFSGFGRQATITIMSVFILTAGLTRTGATRALGIRLVRLGGSEGVVIALFVLAGAVLSLFMNNIAAAAALMPAAMGVAEQRRISPAKLMMPLAFGTLLGGMATLLTTANILVNSALRDAGYAQFGLLDFAPIGLPLVAIGVLYMALIGRRALPAHIPAEMGSPSVLTADELARLYGLAERWVELRVAPGSNLAGGVLADAGLGSRLGVNVVAIRRQDRFHLAPGANERLQEGDRLLVQARQEQLEDLRALGLEPLPDEPSLSCLSSGDARLFEVIPAPRSLAVGKALPELHIREKYGLNVIALWREGRSRRVGLGEIPLRNGDALLVLGTLNQARLLESEGEFLVLAEAAATAGLRPQRMPHAIAVMGAAVLVASFGWLAPSEAMLAGALAMVLVGAITMDEAYLSIEWRTVFVVAAMLPVGVAMSKTGMTQAIGLALVGWLKSSGPLAVMGALLVVTALLTQFVGSTTVAVILAPVAIQAAGAVGGNPRTFALAVAYGCSLAFLTPLSHPANMLVMGPGGYKFSDYLRVGALLELLLLAAVLALLPVVWGV